MELNIDEIISELNKNCLSLNKDKEWMYDKMYVPKYNEWTMEIYNKHISEKEFHYCISYYTPDECREYKLCNSCKELIKKFDILYKMSKYIK